MNQAVLQPWLRLPGGQRHDLHAICTIGRAPDCSLRLPDDDVSRRHAILQAQGEGEFWLVDLGSANGTYVNGRRLSQAVRLQKGDVIRIAGKEMEFCADAPGAAQAAAQQSAPAARQAPCWLMVTHLSGRAEPGQQAQALPLSAGQLPRTTGAWFRSCRKVIEECGGRVFRHLGGGFCSWWEDSEDGAIQVRQAVAKLHEAQAAENPPFRVALHFGSATLSILPPMNVTHLQGPEVDLALGLDQAAAAMKQRMLFSEAAVKRMHAEGEVALAGESAVEGSTGQHRLYRPAHY